jgi:hypothetical protein
MTALPSHTFFEQLLGRGEPSEEPLPSLAVVYFTAIWCKKCKTFDLPKIMSALPQATWYKNDIDKNENSYAYSKLRSIPSFVVIQEKKYMGKLDVETVMEINLHLTNEYAKTHTKEETESYKQTLPKGVTEEYVLTWLKQFV